MRAIYFWILVSGLGVLAGISPCLGEDGGPQVDALIARMTPEEKAAQLQSVQFKDLLVDGRLSLEKCREKMPYGIGEVCGCGSATTLHAPEIKADLTELQDYLRAKTRLGLPCIPHEENITGLPVLGATTYPQMIGMGCTWDP